MDNRRVRTEECDYDDLTEDSEFYKKQLEFYQDSEEEVEDDYDEEQVVDHNNYKGIYIDEEPGAKFQDPETGAHFEYNEIYNKLLQVEEEVRRSQERDKKTIAKNKELLKLDEDSDVYQQQILFRTQDNTKSKQPNPKVASKMINEILSLGTDTGMSYDSQKFQSAKAIEKHSSNFIQMKGSSFKYDSMKSTQKSSKKPAPKKISEMIFLK